MSKFNPGDRVFLTINVPWDTAAGCGSCHREQVDSLGWTGTITDAWPNDGYGVLLENDPWNAPAWFRESELSSLEDYNIWVDDVISGEVEVPWFAK